jgi:hypothetical protein
VSSESVNHLPCRSIQLAREEQPMAGEPGAAGGQAPPRSRKWWLAGGALLLLAAAAIVAGVLGSQAAEEKRRRRGNPARFVTSSDKDPYSSLLKGSSISVDVSKPAPSPDVKVTNVTKGAGNTSAVLAPNVKKTADQVKDEQHTEDPAAFKGLVNNVLQAAGGDKAQTVPGWASVGSRGAVCYPKDGAAIVEAATGVDCNVIVLTRVSDPPYSIAKQVSFRSCDY